MEKVNVFFWYLFWKFKKNGDKPQYNCLKKGNSKRLSASSGGWVKGCRKTRVRILVKESIQEGQKLFSKLPGLRYSTYISTNSTNYGYFLTHLTVNGYFDRLT